MKLLNLWGLRIQADQSFKGKTAPLSPHITLLVQPFVFVHLSLFTFHVCWFRLSFCSPFTLHLSQVSTHHGYRLQPESTPVNTPAGQALCCQFQSCLNFIPRNRIQTVFLPLDQPDLFKGFYIVMHIFVIAFQ